MKYICVYCGSSDNAPESHKQAARDLGKAIVKAGYGLVYGGAKVGLMGCIADSVLEAGGQVHGVVTPIIKELGVVHEGIQCTVASDYDRRKQMMRELSDAFIALPGGLGTFDELLNTAINNQFASFSKDVGNPVKAVGVLNIDGFFDAQLKQLDVAVENRYMKQSHRDMVFAANDATTLVEHIRCYERPGVDQDRWWEKKDLSQKPDVKAFTESEGPTESLKNRWLKQWDIKKDEMPKPQEDTQVVQAALHQLDDASQSKKPAIPGVRKH